ncbi:MAG: rhomboid family intramembrane serine protease [Anaerolineae bacterium]|nr:rhomboid family intramembrane serine protease [Anaerolineae bacterium]
MLDKPEQPARKVHPLEASRQPAPHPQVQTVPGAPVVRRRLMFARASRRPYVMYGLIVINVAIFVLRALSPTLDLQLLVQGANSAEGVLQNGEYWRLFTSMFLHASIYDYQGGYALQNVTHILFNMYVLYASGRTVERFFGHTRFLLIYLLGGMTGSLLSALMGVGLSVGASGAVAATLGAEFSFYSRHRELLGERGQAMRSSLIRLALINVLFGLASSYSSNFRVDNWAHLGGAVGGLVLGALAGSHYVASVRSMNQRLVIARDRSDMRASLARLAAYAAGFVLILLAVTVARG